MNIDKSLNLLKKKLSETEQIDRKSIKVIIQNSKRTSLRFLWISIIEFFIWIIANVLFLVFFNEKTPQSFTDFTIIVVLEKLNYFVTIIFIVMFYYRYKSISIFKDISRHIESVYNLKILTYQYVIYNLCMFAIVFLLSSFWEINNNEELSFLDNNIYNKILAYIFSAILCLILTLGLKWVYQKLFGKKLRELLKIRNKMMEENS